MNVTTPAVILPPGHHAGLGIARSLGRLGVPVYSVDEARWDPAFSSRFCRGRFFLNWRNLSPDERLDGLLKIGRQLGGSPILITTTDRDTVWAAENSAALREAFRFPERDPGLIRALCDKSRMQELARRAGVPTAQSLTPRSNDEVARFARTAAFPVVVKALDAERLRARLGGTKFIIQTAPDLLALCSKAIDGQGPDFLIQEFLPGEDWMFEGYFDENSRCAIGVTAKKVRRFPPHTGATSLGVCLPNEVVHRLTTGFMNAIRYRGILDIGYRYDRRDGQFKVLDVNPRVGSTFRLFVAANGMDVIRALYLDMTGQAIPSGQAAHGRKWIVEDFDLVSALRACSAGGLTVKDWFASLRGVQEAACFSLDDPLPLLMVGVADCFEFCRWIRGWGAARRRPAVSVRRPFGEEPATFTRKRADPW